METLSEVKVSKDLKCLHCGDDCSPKVVNIDHGLPFCCHGCETVYYILKNNDLDFFYTLDQNAGLSQKETITKGYEYLDDIIIQKSLCSYMDDRIAKIQLFLPTIHCTSCLWLLENISRLNQGIQHSSVNYIEKKVLIQIKRDEISLKELIELLSRIGYPPSLTLKDTTKATSPKDKNLIYKLGISGFVFGNIMLLSFPEYLGLADNFSTLSSYLSFLNLVLAIPLILYCSNEYFLSAYHGLRQKHFNINLPISIGILALFIKSTIDTILNTGSGYFDSLAGLIFFLLIGKWFQKRTYDSIQFDLDYQSYFPVAATIIRDDNEYKIALDQIKNNDIIRVRNGELIPADGHLISPSVSIDYSFVTGEKEKVIVRNEEGVFSGGRIVGKLADIRVEKEVSTSYLTQLWNDSTFNQDDSVGNLTQINSKLSKYFTLTILFIALSTFFYHVFFDWKMAVDAFTSVLIIACPCAIALSIPFTFGNINRLLAKQNIFLRNTKVIEDCAKLDYLVFDKTGTITQKQKIALSYHGKLLSNIERKEITSVAKQSTHEMSKMIASFFKVNSSYYVSSFEENIGLGIQGEANGTKVIIGSRHYLDNKKIETFENKYKHSKNYNVFLQINKEIVGAFFRKSEYANHLSSTLQSLSSSYKISLLSGDNNNDKDSLMEVSHKWEFLLFEKSPFEKLNFIKTLQETNKVAMIGDGLNDAGALSQSDVGVAISQDTMHFTPASDIIINAKSLAYLPKLFKICKSAITIIYLSYALAIIYNIVGLSYAVQGILSPLIAAILMPLSSITVVLFGIICSTILVRKSFK